MDTLEGEAYDEFELNRIFNVLENKEWSSDAIKERGKKKREKQTS